MKDLAKSHPSFRDRFRAAESLGGFQLTSVSPHWPRQLAGAMDFVFIDGEHHCFSREQVAFLCGAYRSAGIEPIVRVLEPRAALVRAAIDDGAGGIVAPYVETVEQVRELVAAVKLRPIQGQRAAAAMADRPLEAPMRAMVDDHCRTNTLIIQIESQIGVDQCDALLGVDGVDGVLVGSFDLTATLGCLNDHADDRYVAAVRRIAQVCQTRSLGAGIFFAESPEKERWAQSLGYHLLMHGCDWTLIREAMRLRMT